MVGEKGGGHIYSDPPGRALSQDSDTEVENEKAREVDL